MRFNRRIGVINAISFDLDDTLYSNKQVMLKTMQAMQSYFTERFRILFSANNIFQRLTLQAKANNTPVGSIGFWLPYAKQVLTQKPLIKNDVTAMRLNTYALGFKQLGLTTLNSWHEAEQAMAHFSAHRNIVNIPESIHDFLKTLKQNYQLIAISNGNVCTNTIGLAGYFDHVFHAEKGLQQKPSSDLFQLACQKLQLKPKQILHVGDCGYADILGAQRAGFHSAWLNCYDVGKPIHTLPDIELNQVTDLAKLF